ncbi:hypothetical protein M2322_004722 [Rhodoblastus acidophilus]|uniref:hypothetical protein n=1 Tax=Rhodoblastus acidophilus TaxID=1074 RepID=UPI0022249CB4|nr:hypothetical protein [Rhodoblastus acidophilus]MCW2319153.1 hypothetical protein [Rhodoblastus acidophilus]
MTGAQMAILVAARWTQFIALFVLFGGLLFPFYATFGDARAINHESRRLARRVLAVAGAAQIVSIVVWLAVTIAGLGDGWGALSDADLTTSYLLDTGFGHVWLARLALSLGLAGILFAARSSLFERNVPNESVGISV